MILNINTLMPTFYTNSLYLKTVLLVTTEFATLESRLSFDQSQPNTFWIDGADSASQGMVGHMGKEGFSRHSGSGPSRVRRDGGDLRAEMTLLSCVSHHHRPRLCFYREARAPRSLNRSLISAPFCNHGDIRRCDGFSSTLTVTVSVDRWSTSSSVRQRFDVLCTKKRYTRLRTKTHLKQKGGKLWLIETLVLRFIQTWVGGENS